MPIAPPAQTLMELPAIGLMEIFGRMRNLTDKAGFNGTLPAIWQCSDESQAIKKALFGYVYNYPPFNLGLVGSLLDPKRMMIAAQHGKDLVIFGGSHIGALEQEGCGYIERVHDRIDPCCGMLHRVLDDYLQAYRRATQLIKLSKDRGICKIEVPYKYLFKKPSGDTVRIRINLANLVEGDALGEGSLGKIYRLNRQFLAVNLQLSDDLQTLPQPIGDLLQPTAFSFKKRLDHESLEPKNMLEAELFDFLPEVVANTQPHRRLCNINTWRQFHRSASFITDAFDGSDRNIFVLSGLTIDHNIRHNSFIPQFGFWMEQGRALEAKYYGPQDINALLAEQEIYRPPVTFLEYAGL